MTYCLVVGVDPGESTGLFALRDGRRFAAYQGAPAGALAALRKLLAVARVDGADVLVACERYVDAGGGPGRRVATSPVAQRVVGQVQEVCTALKVEVVLQAPADAKAFAPTAFLREHGLYVTRHDVEQRDANDANDGARHAVLCLATRRARLFERLFTGTGA